MHKNHTNNTNGIIPPILTHNTIVSTNYHWDKAYNSPSRFVEGMARKRSDWRRNYDNQILILLTCKNHRACSEVHTFTRTDSQNDDRCIMLCRYCLMMLIVRYRSSNQPLARTHASRVEIKAILERDDLNMTADTVTPVRSVTHVIKPGTPARRCHTFSLKGQGSYFQSIGLFFIW